MKHFICLVFILIVDQFGGAYCTINDAINGDEISVYPQIYLESEYISIKSFLRTLNG